MPLATGIHHVATVTSDLDRLIDFYTSVFDAEVILDMDDDEARHAMIDLGGGLLFHPFELPENDHAQGSSQMFERGHIDHLAIGVEDLERFEQIRSRLVTAGACDGTLTDFGMVRTVWFTDPDGMGCEIAMTADGAPRTFEDRGVEPQTTT